MTDRRKITYSLYDTSVSQLYAITDRDIHSMIMGQLKPKIVRISNRLHQELSRCRPPIVQNTKKIASFILKYVLSPTNIVLKYSLIPLVFLATILFFVRLVPLYTSDPTQFWAEAPFTVGVVAAILAGITAAIALGSLRITRASQRPFLTTVEEPEEPVVIGEATNPRIILHIKNTGNLPADRISILCVLFTSTNEDIGISLRHAKTALAPPIYFPGVTAEHTYYMEKEQFQECQKGLFTIRILIKYDNRTAKKTCNTQRSFIYEALTKTPLSPINSTHRDDWWD